MLGGEFQGSFPGRTAVFYTSDTIQITKLE